MLDFGMTELLVIACVLVFIIGPQDVPGLMQGLGRIVRRLMYMKHAVSMQMDQMMGVVDPQEVNTTLQKDMQTPEIEAEDEFEAREDDDFDPRPEVMQDVIRSEDHTDTVIETSSLSSPEDDPAIRDQQDLFAVPKQDNAS